MYTSLAITWDVETNNPELGSHPNASTMLMWPVAHRKNKFQISSTKKKKKELYQKKKKKKKKKIKNSTKKKKKKKLYKKKKKKKKKKREVW